MGKYFGTDGVRGVANTELTSELAHRIGRCGGYVLARGVNRPKVVIGMDTRLSGVMLESAIVSGLLSTGTDVVRLGVVPTPAVAYITRLLGAQAGVMISASHNPMQDNGIKFFGQDGFKLSDETESEIERLIDAKEDKLPRPTGGEIGRIIEDGDSSLRYLNHLKTTIESNFNGLKIVLDCAHGAAYDLAPKLFIDLGAEVIVMGAEPNGVNINECCGSTDLRALKKEVVIQKADLGLAFDGDADRLIAVDNNGDEVDGDFILCICGHALARKGQLQKNTIVSTVMSNIGFYKALDRLGLNTVKTSVGDRYVMETMRQGNFNLGGEQSGHVIFLDYNTTGDGMLTGIQLVNVIKQSGQKLSELRTMMKQYPQVLVNVKVSNKKSFEKNRLIWNTIREIEQKLSDNGRVFVRPSGTEACIRVMAEGPNTTELKKFVSKIVDVVKSELT